MRPSFKGVSYVDATGHGAPWSSSGPVIAGVAEGGVQRPIGKYAHHLQGVRRVVHPEPATQDHLPIGLFQYRPHGSFPRREIERGITGAIGVDLNDRPRELPVVGAEGTVRKELSVRKGDQPADDLVCTRADLTWSEGGIQQTPFIHLDQAVLDLSFRN